MQLTGIFVEGFQAIEEPVFIPIKPLTFLYGPNSAGKSAIKDAIEYLRELVTGSALASVHRQNWVHRKDNEIPDMSGLGGGLSRLGFEFEVAKQYWEDLTEAQRSSESLGLEMLSSIQNRHIQVEFGDHLQEMSFAVDGAFVFSVRYEDRTVDYLYRSDGDDSDEFASGTLTINWKHPFWKNSLAKIDVLTAFADPNGGMILSYFFARRGEYLDISGITLSDHVSESHRPLLAMVSDFCEPTLTASKHISAWKVIDKRDIATIRRDFSKLSTTKKREDAKRHVNYLVEDLNVFLDCIWTLSAKALSMAYVRGDRQLVSQQESRSHIGFSQVETLADTESSLSEYSKYLASKLRGNVRAYSANIEHDFVNESLQDFLTSMRRYTAIVDAYQLNRRPRTKRNQRYDTAPVYWGLNGDMITVLLLRDSQGRCFTFSDVGSGMSYLFPILLSLQRNPLSFVEQPELHLHPAAQCDVGDVFVAASNIGHRSIVESHSEHMLLRVLRRIRETGSNRQRDKRLKVLQEDVCVLYFHPMENGSTQVKRLRIDRTGEFLDRWPNGFFDERERELFDE